MVQTEAVKQMRERAEAVQTVVAEVSDLQEALRYVVDLTLRQGGASIAAPGLGGEELNRLRVLCDEASLALLTENLRDSIATIHTGFTKADWGIAETGTLVMDSSSEDTRIATMLSEVHVAYLPDSRIKADAVEIEEELALLMRESPRYLSFISGASRTADIERVLTIGVHGPQELHILIGREGQA